jgi:hypothetical protein
MRRNIFGNLGRFKWKYGLQFRDFLSIREPCSLLKKLWMQAAQKDLKDEAREESILRLGSGQAQRRVHSR